MQETADQTTTPVHIVHAALIWIALSELEFTAAFYLDMVPRSITYYYIALGMTFAVFAAIPLMGKQPIVGDIQEICFYDVLVQILGLGLFAQGYSTASYVILAQMITVLKFIRVAWPILCSTFNLPLNWPPFGVLGLIRLRWGSSPTMDLTLAQKQKLILVLAALMPIVFFTLQGWLKLSLPLPQPLVLIAALFGIRPLIKALEKREANHRQTQRELDKAAFAAEADARMIAALTEKNAEIERQAAELALKNTQLEALSAERAAMLADLAERNVSLRDAGHDFKVPLLGLTSLLNQVQDRATDDVQVQLLEQLDKGVEELRIMMFDLIEQGKAGTEMGKPLVQRLNVLDLAAYFHDSFYLAAHKRDVSFAVREEDFAIVANEMLLRRVISNLANNAILYSEPGTRVTLSFRRSSKRCFVRVYNTGPGIAEGSGPNRTANFNALIDRIKHRRQPITPNASQGHGLGLQIVERLCTELGTSISLQSHPGTFTVFRFSLPLAD